MKIDKWPEEIECEGWKWTLNKHVICGSYYVRTEEIRVPPTAQEIFEHLICGGQVRYGDVNDEDARCIYYKLVNGKLMVCVMGGPWVEKNCTMTVPQGNPEMWSLVGKVDVTLLKMNNINPAPVNTARNYLKELEEIEARDEKQARRMNNLSQIETKRGGNWSDSMIWKE